MFKTFLGESIIGVTPICHFDKVDISLYLGPEVRPVIIYYCFETFKSGPIEKS